MSASASPASALVPGTPGESQWVSAIWASAVDKANAQREYKSADGRVYWSHALTKQSVWEKPDELKVSWQA